MSFRIDDLTVAILPERFDVLAAGECGACTDCTECTDDTSVKTTCSTPLTGTEGPCDPGNECAHEGTKKALRTQLDHALAAIA